MSAAAAFDELDLPRSSSVTVRHLLCVALAVVSLVTGSAFAAPKSLVIQGDSKIAGYAIKADGTLFGAIQRFGQPTSLRHERGPGLQGWNACVGRWRGIGLKIVFYNLGGRDSCRPQYGYFRDALITGKQWRTAAGLRSGHPWKYIARYHPRARPAPGSTSWWWLVARSWPFGAGGSYGALSAKGANGSIVAFQVYYQAGGE